jgi:dihydrofolate synthase/folylpolyglutamate synthase
MTFAEAVAAISALEKRGWRLGLDRMRAFVEAAGLQDAIGPDRRFIHVAGTNGKGSTTAFLQSLLVEQGWRTGAYYSPYVVDVRERVQIGRELISEELFAELTEALLDPAEALSHTEYEGPTEFEFKTALGFAAWEREGCEWVALEVGLGGRLDATNVVVPACGIIVSIGWDHMEVLGDTLEKIAAEKAGIIKPGAPVIVGEMAPGPRDVILGIARERGAEAWLFGREVRLEAEGCAWRVEAPGGSFGGLTPGIRGAMQPHNMALAIAAMHRAGAIRDPGRVAEGAARAYIPGRFQELSWRGAKVVLDGAHNLDSARVLAASLLQELGGEERRAVLLTGMLQGHHPEPFYSALAPLVKAAHFAPIAFHRARDPRELAALVAGTLPAVAAHDTLEAAAGAALGDCAPGDLLLVTGSFYLVGEVARLMSPEGA